MKKAIFILIGFFLVFGMAMLWQQPAALAQDQAPDDGGMGCDGMAEMFPPPEVDQNRATLSMFPRPQVDNIVIFLKTLSDGYFER